MNVRWIRTPALAALGAGLSASLLLALPGCGGGAGESGEAIVIPSEPGATATSGASAPAAGGGAAATPAATAAATTPAAPAAPAGKAEGFGTLTGRVVFAGDPPQPKELNTSTKDPEVCAKEPHKSQQFLVDPESKGVRFAVVYIPNPTAVNDEAKSEKSQAQVEFDQKNCIFEPHVLAVMKGATVEMKSSDPVNHNINAKFNVNSPMNQILSGGQTVDYAPKAAERRPIPVTCDIHPWMQAWWLVTESPYFAVTDEKGNFEIKNVPAGAQKVVVWQEAVTGGGFVTAPSGESIAVKADDSTSHEFTIPANKVRLD